MLVRRKVFRHQSVLNNLIVSIRTVTLLYFTLYNTIKYTVVTYALLDAHLIQSRTISKRNINIIMILTLRNIIKILLLLYNKGKRITVCIIIHSSTHFLNSNAVRQSLTGQFYQSIDFWLRAQNPLSYIISLSQTLGDLK